MYLLFNMCALHMYVARYLRRIMLSSPVLFAGGSKGRASAAASGGNMSTDDAQFAAEQAQLLKQAFGRKPSTAAGGSAQGGRFSGEQIMHVLQYA
jgi:hypothetical protein